MVEGPGPLMAFERGLLRWVSDESYDGGRELSVRACESNGARLIVY